tara:strand:+ start:357 stop:620 length:264 start_codon:yes stop_codon:yes gene_type:complete
MAFTPFKKMRDKRKKKKQRRAKYDPSPLGSMQMRIDDLAKERDEIKSKDKIDANDRRRLKEVQRIINLTDRNMERYKKKNMKLSDNI